MEITRDTELTTELLKELKAEYKKIYKTTDFDSLFNVYLSRYPLTKEELKLFFVIISLPWKIDDNNDSEYDRQVKVLELLIYLDKTEKIVSKYYTDNEKE